MNGYARYQNLMANWAESVILPYYKAHKQGQTLPPIDPFFQKIFQGFIEISQTIDSLRFTQLLLSLQPPKSRKIQKPDYLKHLVGVHLQEVYILKERLNEYATKIKRAYSNSTNKSLVNDRITPLFDSIRMSLEPLTSARSEHVHRQRYNDEILAQAELFSFVNQFSDSQDFKDLSTTTYLQAKQQWKLKFQKNMETITALIDNYFDVLFEVITANNEISPPNNNTQIPNK